MDNNKRVNELLKKYLDKNISTSEGEELFDRLRQINNPQTLENLFQTQWNNSKSAQQLAPVEWEALLKMSKTNTKPLRKSKTIGIWKWAVAASIAVLASVYIWTQSQADTTIVYSTEYGTMETIFLSDGTEVVLNANSTLEWEKAWSKDGVRKVILDGEAFFKVAHIDAENEGESLAMPFQVVTENLTVNVLGTSFNVSNRRGNTDVFLEEGKVELDLNRDVEETLLDPALEEEIASTSSHSLVMEPGELVTFSAKNKALNKRKLSSNTPGVWKDGTLTFTEVSVKEVLDELRDIYGKEFVVEDSTILSTEVSFGIPYKDWTTVENLMELTLNIEIEEIGENQIQIRKTERIEAN